MLTGTFEGCLSCKKSGQLHVAVRIHKTKGWRSYCGNLAKPGKEKKVVRVLSGDRMSVDQPNKSVQSFAPSSMDMGNMI